MNAFDIYTDGACPNNGLSNARGGWGISVVPANTEDILFENYGKLRTGHQTSNRCEMEAMLQALLYIRERPNANYRIFCDSEVVTKGVNGKAERKANRDLWDQIEFLCNELLSLHEVSNFEVIHFKSDKNNYTDVYHRMNNYTDGLACQGANCLTKAPTVVKLEKVG